MHCPARKPRRRSSACCAISRRGRRRQGTSTGLLPSCFPTIILLPHNVSCRDTTTGKTLTHNPPEDRFGIGTYCAGFGAKHSRAISLSERICLVVRLSSPPRLAADHCEYCPLRLYLLAGILVHSRHCWTGALICGGLVPGSPAVATQGLVATFGCIRRPHRRLRTSSRDVRGVSASARS